MTHEILVFSDDANLLAQLTGKARLVASAAGWSVAACCLCGTDTATTAGLSAAEATGACATSETHPDAQACAAALTEAACETGPQLVLVGATRLGMEVAPRLAERWGAGYAAWAHDLEVDASTGMVKAFCMLYAGTGIAEYRFRSRRTVLTVADGVFEPDDTLGSDVPMRRLAPAHSSSPIRILRSQVKSLHVEDLEHSKLVVDCGKGLRSMEDLELARSLAALLSGQVGCSRPLASERDWFADWLGLSGMRIKPELCLAVGISGSVQHLIGIRDARLIVAVNHDKDAAIFTQADFGVVADLREFLPALIERLKERAIRPSWHSAGDGQPVPSHGPTVGHRSRV